MNELGLIRAINDAFETEVDKNGHEYDKKAFFAACRKPIKEFVDANMPSVLFFGLSVGNLYNDNYELLTSQDLDQKFIYFGKGDTTQIKQKINDFIVGTENDEIINLTSILLKEKHGPDLFFWEDKDEKILKSYEEKGIITDCTIFTKRPYSFNLNKLSDTDNFDAFKQENKNIEAVNNFINLLKLEVQVIEEGVELSNEEHKRYYEIAKYLWHYKTIIKEARELFPIIHLIRPRLAQPEYNLLLTIATSGELESQKIALLNDTIYRIMSMAAMKGERERADREKISLISSHKHTMRNFGIKEHLANLKIAIQRSSQDKALEILHKLDNLSLFKDITIDMMYRIDQQEIEELLIYKKKITTYSKILWLIHNGTIDERCTMDIQSDISEELDIVPKNDVIDIFNLLNNMYSNGLRESKTEFFISLKEVDNELVISFKNDKLLDSQFINNENELQIPGSYPKDKGLGIIDSICKKKEFISLQVFLKKQKTTFQLTIKSKTI